MGSDTSPAVSVIIPVYNGANYLREAIDSVLAQTFTDYELLVIDDGSTDGTWEIIQSYGTRLRGFRKPNGGVASALNLGIQEARGEWIAWLSHDDVFLPNKLERQVKFLRQSPQFKACYTSFYVIDVNGNIIREYNAAWYPREQAARMLFRTTYINGSSMLIERSCFDKVGLFNETLRHTQDVEMWFRMAQHFEIGRIPEKLLQWRTHPAQGSRNYQVQIAEEQAMFRQVYNELGIAGIFPELAESANDQQIIAWGHEWLGDTMLTHHGWRWYAFVQEEYQQAIAVWPSWRNRARLKRVLVRALYVCRPWYRHARYALRRGLRAIGL